MASGNTGWWSGANSWSGGYLKWSSTSNGSAANSSKVTVTLYVKRLDGGTSYNYSTSNNFWITCNGTKKTGTCQSVSGQVTAVSSTFTVSHNNDGTKSITISGGGSIPGTTFNINSKSLTAKLDTIPRYTSITTWRLDSVTQTSATFTWATADAISSGKIYIDGSTTGTSVSIASGSKTGSFTYNGLTPGKTFSIKFEAVRKDSGLATKSSGISVTTNPIVSASNLSSFSFNVGSDVSITIKNPNYSDFFVRFYISDGSSGWSSAIINNTISKQSSSSDYSYTLSTSSVSSSLYSNCKDANEKKCKIVIGSTINGTDYSNEYVGTYNITNSNPSFSSFTLTNNGSSSLISLLGSQYSVKGYADFTISIPSGATSLKNSAEFKRYDISVSSSSGSTQKISIQNDSGSSFKIQEKFNISSANTYTVYVQAFDSRENSSSAQKTSFTVLPYEPPNTANIQIGRLNDFEKQIWLNFKSNYSKLLVSNVVKNSITSVKFCYKKSGESSFSGWTSITGLSSSEITSTDFMLASKIMDGSHGGYMIGSIDSGTGLDSNESYIVRLSITDRITTSTIDLVVASGVPIFFRGTNGQVCVGRMPKIDSDAKFQVNGDILFDLDSMNKDILLSNSLKNMVIVSDAQPTNQNVGLWLEVVGYKS